MYKRSSARYFIVLIIFPGYLEREKSNTSGYVNKNTRILGQWGGGLFSPSPQYFAIDTCRVSTHVFRVKGKTGIILEISRKIL